MTLKRKIATWKMLLLLAFESVIWFSSAQKPDQVEINQSSSPRPTTENQFKDPVNSQDLGPQEINLMGPLLIGDPQNMDSPESQKAWDRFRDDLREAKKLGVTGISTDIWWGLVEKQEGQYQWEYYDRMVRCILQAGLQWNPILSFHQLGGNVGDKGYVPIPDWVWSRVVPGLPQGNRDSSPLMYLSEQGNLNKEVVSVWGTPFIMNDLQRFMLAFREHFASVAGKVGEINISLGPSGELRYPSYNSHDKDSGWPNRGSFQSYSELAVRSFRREISKKYKNDIGLVNQAWGSQLTSFREVFPPNPSLINSIFFARGEHFSPYGRDFFDWYNQSLVDHGLKVTELASNVFGVSHSPFKKAVLGAKFPGVHWRTGGSRSAELAAGLIRTSYGDWYSEESGYGYRKTLSPFRRSLLMRFALTFTAIEMNDREYDGGKLVKSKAHTLTEQIGKLAQSLGIELRGENALSEELGNLYAWKNISLTLEKYGYQGVTLLRMGALIGSRFAEEQLRSVVERLKRRNSPQSGMTCASLLSGGG